MPIKLARIRSGQIGHFVFDTQYHLRRTQLTRPLYYLCTFFVGVESNTQWAKMVRRHYTVHPIFHYVWLANRLFRNAKSYELQLTQNYADVDSEELFGRTSSQVLFNSEEQHKGFAYLEKLGLKNNEKFVCLLVRESSYKQILDKSRDWSYHSYRDSDVNLFVDAAEKLAKKGYWVIRMGKYVSDPLRSDHPRIVDYAMSKDRADFLDIWLMANCYFCITTGTGLDAVAGMSDRPCLYVNLLPLNHIKLYKNSLTVPKKLRWKRSGRLLNLEEYISHGYTSTQEYERHEIEIEELRSQEITEVVIEMENRVSGVVDKSDDDKQRQATALSIILESDKLNKTRHNFNHDPNATLGSEFLKRYWAELNSKRRKTEKTGATDFIRQASKISKRKSQ